MRELSGIRTEYTKSVLRREDLHVKPIEQFKKWMQEALDAKCQEPTAMNLATVNANGFPTSRIVLLKDTSDLGFTFFTNYHGAKGRHMEKQPHVALTFFWAELERQVRIEGRIEKVTPDESDDYFQSRPRESQIGAWVSQQSVKIDAHADLQRQYDQVMEKYAHQQIPRPKNWGGYRVVPHMFEFWQGRASRLHDRFQYTKQGSDWVISRLAP
ncbi:MAG: pyridoxamine 5'-phosphate oxidase [Marinilabiliaceae bacterium]|nr:pyridoxamine 5'-phosphate oxidase [Marinilabiliaceae bacterium]